MTGVWHLRDANKYGMSVYGSRKGAPAQAIYTVDWWRKGARFLPCFFLSYVFCSYKFYHVCARAWEARLRGWSGNAADRLYLRWVIPT
jgi:hypothetical protein